MFFGMMYFRYDLFPEPYQKFRSFSQFQSQVVIEIPVKRLMDYMLARNNIYLNQQLHTMKCVFF